MTDDTRGMLRATFPQLNADTLDGLVRAVRTVAYPAGTRLCTQGEEGRTFYILVQGHVGVFQRGERGTQQVDSLGPGQFFGGMSLLMDQPRNADVVASGDVQVIEIDREIFAQYIKSNPQIVVMLNQQLLQRVLSQEQRLLRALPGVPTEPDARQVFISYAREDQAFVYRLADELVQRGIAIWLDRQQIKPGSLWSEQIQAALDRSHMMVVVLSPQAVVSRNVADEWHYFLDEDKPIVPVLYELCRVPFQLRRIQHVAFAGADYEQALEQLVARLRDSGA